MLLQEDQEGEEQTLWLKELTWGRSFSCGHSCVQEVPCSLSSQSSPQCDDVCREQRQRLSQVKTHLHGSPVLTWTHCDCCVCLCS